ncbi:MULTISPECIES: hypothetical protein [unclassified Blastococcus]
MAPSSSAPAPGSMTVDVLFQWEVLATVVLVAAVLAIAAVVALSAAPGASDRSEWQRWLAARSRTGAEPGGPRADG